jgi:hypothetical protein
METCLDTDTQNKPTGAGQWQGDLLSSFAVTFRKFRESEGET